jgi:transmembrane sensor
MTEEKFIALITKKFTGELSSLEAGELHSAVTSNPELGKKYRIFCEYWSKNSFDHSRDQQLFQRISVRIAEHDAPVPVKRSFKHWKLFIAAALCLAFFIALQYYSFNPSIVKRKEILVIQTGRAEKRQLLLPDGSRVILNADTRITFPEKFDGSNREVFLIGEAYFDVKRKVEQPFVIHAGKMNIKVLGTSFNVKSYPGDKLSETTLLKGAVEVTLNDRPDNRIILKPKEKVSVNTTAFKDGEKLNDLRPEYTVSHITSISKNFPILETSWLEDKLIFNNEDFETLAKQISRKYNVDVDFADEKLKHLRFTGTFQKETLHEALKTLQLLEDFSYRVSNKKIMVY